MTNPEHDVMCRSTVKNPVVSVFVASYQSGRYLRAALDSILGQPDIALECVVADDGSDDGTAAILAGPGGRDARVTAIRLGRNCGKSVAANLAARYAKADWLCVFDADDVMLPGTLAPYVRFVLARAGAFWGYCQTRLANGSLAAGGGLMGRRFDRVALPVMNGICGGMSLFRRDCFERVGGFDPALRAGVDYDLSLRLAEHGDPVYWPGPGFLYRRHDANMTGRSPDSGEAVRARLARRLEEASESPLVARNRQIFRVALEAHAALRRGDWAGLDACTAELGKSGVESPSLDLMRVLSLRRVGRPVEALAIALRRIDADLADGCGTPEELASFLVHGLELAELLDKGKVKEILLPLARQVASLAGDPALAALAARP